KYGLLQAIKVRVLVCEQPPILNESSDRARDIVGIRPMLLLHVNSACRGPSGREVGPSIEIPQYLLEFDRSQEMRMNRHLAANVVDCFLELRRRVHMAAIVLGGHLPAISEYLGFMQYIDSEIHSSISIHQ